MSAKDDFVSTNSEIWYTENNHKTKKRDVMSFSIHWNARRGDVVKLRLNKGGTKLEASTNVT